MEFFKPFKQWTDRIEADKEVTIHQVWPTLLQMEHHLEISIDPEVEEDDDFKMIEFMKSLGREYISSIRSDIEMTDNHRIGVVLNPKTKKLRKMLTVDRDNVYAKIDQYIRNSTTEQVQSNTATVDLQKQKSELTYSLDDFMDSDEDTTVLSVYSQELTTYLNDRVSDVNFDLRSWWYQNRDRYRCLFKLFLRISAIPASSAPSERTFSTSGSIVTERRSSLLPKSIENIMLVRNLYRS